MSYNEATSELGHRDKAEGKSCMDEIVHDFSRLEVAAESLGRSIDERRRPFPKDAHDRAAAIAPELRALSAKEPNNTIGLLKICWRSNYVKVMSGKKDRPSTHPVEKIPSLLTQVFAVSEDIAFLFVNSKGIDAGKMKKDKEWTVGMYDAIRKWMKAQVGLEMARLVKGGVLSLYGRGF